MNPFLFLKHIRTKQRNKYEYQQSNKTGKSENLFLFNRISNVSNGQYINLLLNLNIIVFLDLT